MEEFHASAAAAEQLRSMGENERQLVRFLEPEMALRQGEYSKILVPQRLVTAHETMLDLGGLELQLLLPGPGHTDGDLPGLPAPRCWWRRATIPRVPEGAHQGNR